MKLATSIIFTALLTAGIPYASNLRDNLKNSNTLEVPSSSCFLVEIDGCYHDAVYKDWVAKGSPEVDKSKYTVRKPTQAEIDENIKEHEGLYDDDAEPIVYDQIVELTVPEKEDRLEAKALAIAKVYIKARYKRFGDLDLSYKERGSLADLLADELTLDTRESYTFWRRNKEKGFNEPYQVKNTQYVTFIKETTVDDRYRYRIALSALLARAKKQLLGEG